MSDISAAVKIEDISSVKKKLSFDVPWADVKTELDTVYRKVGRTAKIKGFRPGKIPRAILEKFYREQAEEETVSNLVNRYYWEAVQEKDIPSVTRPQIDQTGIEPEKVFTFSATVEVEPTIEPKDYLGLELTKEYPVVTEADLEARLQEIRQMFATMEDLGEDRGAAAGDFVTLDFAGSVGDESYQELKSDNYLLEIGSGTFVSGFEDQLIGMKKGESRSIRVKFPENYNAPHLAGKDVDFNVHMQGIRIKKLPEIDAEFVKNFERYESLDALKADVRKSLEEEKKRKVAAEFDRSIGEILLVKNEFEVPESYVERQIYYMMSDAQRRMVSSGMDSKKAAEFSFKLHDQFREEAAKIVKTSLLMTSIARRERLTVDDVEVEKEIREIASQRGQDYESFKKTLEKDGLIENIKNEILNRKTYEFLASKAVVTVNGNGSEVPEEEK
ncbi:MAG: trigger factor [Syntrophales bacterium]